MKHDVEKHQEYDQLMKLTVFYHREAERCQRARAYLAGCVMLGATLEACLLGMVECYAEEVSEKGWKVRPPREWRLSDLLALAKNMGWLPAGLRVGKRRDEWDRRKARVGDYAQVVREIRNLSHPAAYLEEYPGKRITAKHLRFSFEIVNDVADYLYDRLRESILEATRNEGKD